MKLLLTALTLLILVTVPVKAEANDKVGTKVFGVEAEDIIFHGTVTDISSNDSPYGVKYYYSVLYYGYEWMCEQATHRTACYLRK